MEDQWMIAHKNPKTLKTPRTLDIQYIQETEYYMYI